MTRRFFATTCFALGVISLVLWAVAAFAVRSVEEGTVATGIAKKVVEQPFVTDFVTEEAQVLVKASLASSGVDVAALGIEATVDDAVAESVASPAFQESLAGAVDGARESIADQLTSPDSAGQPIVVTLDITSAIGTAVSSIPVVGALVPQLELEPLRITVVNADESSKARSAYSGLRWLATWAGWIGLLLVAIGIALTRRKRWLIPLGLLWAGLGVGAVWVVVRSLTVERLEGALPDEGPGAEFARAIIEYAHEDTLDLVVRRLFLIAAACLVGAVLSFLIVKVASGPANRDSDSEGPSGAFSSRTP